MQGLICRYFRRYMYLFFKNTENTQKENTPSVLFFPQTKIEIKL